MLKYLEIADKMEAWIIEKDLSQGEKLPKLAELMELYDVSKSTIVKALERLENRGLIYQVQGSGVFVRRPKRADYVNLIDNNGFTADLPTHKMVSKVLTLRKIKPPKKVQAVFGPEQTEVYEVRRLRYIDADVLCLEESYFRTDIIMYLNEQIAQGSIFNYVRELGIAIGFSDKYLTVKKLAQKTADLLGVKAGDPALTINEIYYLTSGEPFDYSTTTYHYENSKFFIQSNA